MLSWLVGLAFVGQAPAPAPALAENDESRVRAASVRVRNTTQQTVANGVVIGQSGRTYFVLTVAHGFKEDDKLDVDFFPAKGDAQAVADAKVVVRTDPFGQDVAVIRVEAKNQLTLEKLRLAPAGALPKPPFAGFSFACPQIGAADSQAEKILQSKFVQKKPGARDTQFWIVEAAPELGRSGGPLVDAQGQLLGICSGGNDKVGFYTHAGEIRQILEKNRLLNLVTRD